MASANGASDPSSHVPRPVFVLGSRRSGASLLALVLGQHSALRMVPDTSWVERFAQGAIQSYAEDMESGELSQFRALGITLEQLFEDLGLAINRMMLRTPDHLSAHRHVPPVNGDHPAWRSFGVQPANGSHGTSPLRWVDGCDTHCFVAPVLHRLFPEARFVHVVRDVEEVVASLTNPDNEMLYKSRHLLFSQRDAYEHWLDAVHAGLDAERALGSRFVLRIRRSDLVSSPESTLRRVLEFIQEPFDQRCMRPFQSIPRKTKQAPGSSVGADTDKETADLRRQAELLSFVLMEDHSSLLPHPKNDARLRSLESGIMHRNT